MPRRSRPWPGPAPSTTSTASPKSCSASTTRPRATRTSFDWARRFDEKVRGIMTSAPGDILSVVEDDDYPLAVPTPDHFIPLLYVAGLADAGGRPADVLVEDYAMGSLSMTCFTVGCTDIPVSGAGAAPPLPHIPADESNL